MPRQPIASAVALALCCYTASACSVSTPAAPAPPGVSSSAAADGSTLKVGAPTLVSPIGDAVVTSAQQVTLTIAAVTAQFGGNPTLRYDFELQTDGGAAVTSGSAAGTTFTVPATLTLDTGFKWRARATFNGAAGPWSGLGRFVTPRLAAPTATSSNDAWKNWFFQLIELRGVGPNLTVQALLTLDPDLVAAGVIQETDSARNPRGRLYLPNTSSDRFARSVDLGTFGRPWQWLPRGATTCEGGRCR
jgi:hypothetical protein